MIFVWPGHSQRIPPSPLAVRCIKTVSKPVPFILLGLFAERKQTPQIVEKPKEKVEVMEPKETGPPLHTQEVTGSSPVASTIKINNLQAVRLTSYAQRRRPENQGQSNLWFTRLAASGRAKISAQTSACGDYTLR